jgi:sulfite reductase (NADPH) flavoprotein alpha-component
MNSLGFIPVLPDSAPFSAEQRAYLNGFLAGLFSRAPLPSGAPVPSPSPKQAVPLTILFGSQTGNAENLAKRIAKEAAKQGYAPAVTEMGQYPAPRLAQDTNVLVVTSTYGDGDPPDNAKSFWDALQRDDAPRPLSNTRFAVVGLGDSSYAKFCGFAKALDGRLEALGAVRVLPRCDCDVEFEAPFQQWLRTVLPVFTTSTGNEAPPRPPADLATSPVLAEAAPESSPAYGRHNPFPARLLASRPLCGPDSEKEVRHVEISLDSSGLTYVAGDALGVYPINSAACVAEILRALGHSGEEPVGGPAGKTLPLREALLRHYDVGRIPPEFLRALAEKTGDEALKRVAAPEANGERTRFVGGREVIDMLLAYPQARFAPSEFVSLLKQLQPRLYSISSSPKKYPTQVHLTVGVVQYESHGRQRRGVCSNYLAWEAGDSGPVPVFVHTNKSFRLPPPDRPVLMIGPGTGIAPFRAFLQERAEAGAPGKNWLFFGDQRADRNFLYREELESMRKAGVLHRLDTAFSRDQPEKVYVQHRLLENAKEVFSWLENGASVYVCGDAQRMARDVDQALRRVVQAAGSRSEGAADDYVRDLQTQRRYLRDVY